MNALLCLRVLSCVVLSIGGDAHQAHVNSSSSSNGSNRNLDAQVTSTLTRLGLSEHIPAFEELGQVVGPVRMADLAMLQSHDLRDMGIQDVASRLLLLREAKHASMIRGTRSLQSNNGATGLIQDFIFQIHNYRLQ